jgi:uncharacterized protein involved in exopolysaccharide biosynthesis
VTSEIELDSKLKATEQEIRDTQAQLKAVESQIAGYQGRLNTTPIREQQLSDLTRDYDQSKSRYDSLLNKQMQSQTATNLERRQQGQQFRIIDPPRLPANAYSPNRLNLSLMGLAGGLLLGVCFLAFGSLLPVIIVHILQDVCAVFVLKTEPEA